MKRITATVIVFAVLVICGCGDGGPPLYELSGRVTHKGQPVPYGVITFDPDAEKGNTGPQGTAKIQDGKYTTTHGVTGGPLKVRIIGYDGKPPAGNEASMFPHGRELFGEHLIAIETPNENSTHDFDVN